MIPDPRRELTLEQRLKLLEEEGKRRDKSAGERVIGWAAGLILLAFFLVLPAMLDYLLTAAS